MKNNKLGISSSYKETYSETPLATGFAFYQPILEIIQKYFEEYGLFDRNDHNISKMYIGGPFQYETKDFGTKPTIVVKRGPITGNTRRSIRKMQEYNHQLAKVVYHDMWIGTFIISIMADDYGTTETISSKVFDLLNMLRQEVLAKWGIYEIKEITMSPVNKLVGGSQEHLKICQISSTIVLNRLWSVEPQEDSPESHKLQGADCNDNIL